MSGYCLPLHCFGLVEMVNVVSRIKSWFWSCFYQSSKTSTSIKGMNTQLFAPEKDLFFFCGGQILHLQEFFHLSYPYVCEKTDCAHLCRIKTCTFFPSAFSPFWMLWNIGAPLLWMWPCYTEINEENYHLLVVDSSRVKPRLPESLLAGTLNPHYVVLWFLSVSYMPFACKGLMLRQQMTPNGQQSSKQHMG